MYQINDVIMYGHSGVCKIVDIRDERFGNAETTQYYILRPVYDDKSTIYAPIKSDKIEMRKLLSVEEINDLIKTMPDETCVWIENIQQRRETFSEIIKSGNHKDLIKLIKILYFNREEKNKLGKKFYASDEKAMKEAEKLLYEEFAHVLNIKIDEVVPFINGKLEISPQSI